MGHESTLAIIGFLFAAGALGGLTNAAIADELRLPHKDEEAKVFRPGWIGNVLVGGVAALVLWGLNGPMAAAVVIGSPGSEVLDPSLRVAELFAGVLVGVGGGRFLTTLVEKEFSQREVAALTRTRDSLATAIETLVEE